MGMGPWYRFTRPPLVLFLRFVAFGFLVNEWASIDRGCGGLLAFNNDRPCHSHTTGGGMAYSVVRPPPPTQVVEIAAEFLLPSIKSNLYLLLNIQLRVSHHQLLEPTYLQRSHTTHAPLDPQPPLSARRVVLVKLTDAAILPSWEG
jgi:hypothetical protein